MKKKILVIILAALFLVSCNKQWQEYSGLNEFEVLDVDIEGLSDSEAINKGSMEIKKKYPASDLDAEIYNKIVDEIDFKEKIKSISEFRINNDEIVILDQEDNNIKITDLEGNLIREVGKLGSGDMEFKMPTAFCFDESDKLYYILDSGNRRIVVIDEKFNFVKNINVETLKEKEDYYNPFNSIVLYKDKIYLSETFGSEKTMAIISIDMDGNEKLYEQKFGGFLKVVDDDLYAVENMRGFKCGKKISSGVSSHELEIWNQNCGSIYIVENEGMKKVYSLPRGRYFTDLIKKDNRYYLPGASYGCLYEFELNSNELICDRVVTNQISAGEIGSLSKRFRLQEYKNKIFMSENGNNKIYIIDLDN